MKKNRFLLVTGLLLISVLLGYIKIYPQEANIEKPDYKVRRDKLCSLIPDGVAIIINSPTTEVDFGLPRPNEDFFYLTGVDVPDAKLILVPEKVAKKCANPEYWKTTLYLPSRDWRKGVWDDPQLFPGEEAEKETGMENTADLSTFYTAVSRLSNITDVVYCPLGTRVTSAQNLTPESQFVQSIEHLLPGARIKDLSLVLGDLRWVKTPKEIDIMRNACAITLEAFQEAARITKPGVYEYEIEAMVKYIFRKNGSQGAAFTVIGSGPNSVILHHSLNDRLMKEGELVVIDIGTIYKAISTDLTRTIPVSGSYSPEQKKIYGIVLDAQKKAISMVRPGVTLAELHQAAMDVIAKAGYGKYFIHFLSHTLNGGSPNKPASLGLSTKWVPNATNLVADKPLVPGNMLTIEPGIYIPEKNLGIRIEDDILVTKDGCEILTKDAPREIEEIEKLMKEKTIHLIK